MASGEDAEFSQAFYAHLPFIQAFASAVTDINRLLGTAFSPDNLSHETPLGQSLRGVWVYHNAGNFRHRDFSLWRMQFLVQNLRDIEQYRPAWVPHFARRIRRAGGNDAYFGARYEISVAAALLKVGVPLILQERPDFTVENSGVAIECTSARLRPIGRKGVAHKVKLAAFKKNRLGYGTPSTALFIDITNLAFHEQPFDPTPYRASAAEAASEISFGAIVLTILLMDEERDRIGTYRFREDSPGINSDLLVFLDAYYPRGEYSVVGPSIPFEA